VFRLIAAHFIICLQLLCYGSTFISIIIANSPNENNEQSFTFTTITIAMPQVSSQWLGAVGGVGQGS